MTYEHKRRDCTCAVHTPWRRGTTLPYAYVYAMSIPSLSTMLSLTARACGDFGLGEGRVTLSPLATPHVTLDIGRGGHRIDPSFSTQRRGKKAKGMSGKGGGDLEKTAEF